MPSDLQVLFGPGATTQTRIDRSDATALAAAYAWPDPAPGRRVWVRANMVTSLDGAVTGGDNRSASVSSPVDREVFRVMRGTADVVLVGAGTARAEGYGPAKVHPDLVQARHARGARDAAVIMQVSRSGRVQTDKAMFGEPGAGLVVLPAGDEAALGRAVDAAGEDAVLLTGHVDTGGVDLAHALDQLADRGLTRVLCEGGPSLLGDLMAADLVDELCLTMSPMVVSGRAERMITGNALSGRDFALDGLLHADSTLLARWVRRR